MESEADMKTLDSRVSSLEKRVDKHGQELDGIEERVHAVESNQKVFQLQLEALVEIKNGITKLNESLTDINNTVVESKHKLEMVSISQTEDREEIKNLKKQRDIDHNIKPLSRYENYQGYIALAILGAIITIILKTIGLM